MQLGMHSDVYELNLFKFSEKMDSAELSNCML